MSTNPEKNLGVILGAHPDDYVGGTLPYEVRNPSGDWRQFMPVGEIQRGREDWMDCVTRSATNSIEIQERQQTGVEPNYNDREIAIGSGTTRQGNMLRNVAEYIRKTGLGQQTTYPDSTGTFDQQYATIPADIRAKLDAEKIAWLTKWDVKHEDIPFDKASLQYHLKHAPLQVVIPGHAIVEVFSPADVDWIMDSYNPFLKKVPGNYAGPFVAAKKIVLYKRENAVPDAYLLVDVRYLDGGPRVEKLKRALNALGWMPDMNAYPGYDQKLADLVLNFQKANLSHTSWAYYWAIFFYRGRMVDEATREVINDALSARK